MIYIRINKPGEHFGQFKKLYNKIDIKRDSCAFLLKKNENFDLPNKSINKSNIGHFNNTFFFLLNNENKNNIFTQAICCSMI